jgi:MFS superfamily sulfate permease-like transporter
VADDLAGWHTVPVANPGQIRPGLLVYFFSHSAYYANAQQLSEEMLQLAQNAQPRLSWLCLDAAATALRETHARLQQQGIRLVFAHVSDPLRTALDRCHMTAEVGEDAYYGSIREVLNAYEPTNGASFTWLGHRLGLQW